MFLGWGADHYKHLSQGLSSDPKVVADLTQFCHNFLCLRLELADWGGDGLVFEGEPLKPSQTLRMTTPDGQGKAAPLYLLYLIYGFVTDEEARWLGGKKPNMLETVLRIISQSTGEMSGEASTGDSPESTQGTPDSPAETSGDAQPKSSRRPLRTAKKAA